MNGVRKIRVADVVLQENVYPRLVTDESGSYSKGQAVEFEQLVLDGVLPPIVLAPDNTLLDGRHRWAAYGTVLGEEGEIPYVVRNDAITDMDKLSISCELNAHGVRSLSSAEKKSAFLRVYREDPVSLLDRGVAGIARCFGVAERTLRRWRREVDGEDRAMAAVERLERNERIAERVSAGESQSAVAEDEGVARSRVSQIAKAERLNSNVSSGQVSVADKAEQLNSNMGNGQMAGSYNPVRSDSKATNGQMAGCCVTGQYDSIDWLLADIRKMLTAHSEIALLVSPRAWREVDANQVYLHPDEAKFSVRRNTNSEDDVSVVRV